MSTVWMAANVRLPLGSRLLLEPEVGYWRREPDFDNTLSGIVNLGANLLVSSKGSLRFWGGGGLGLHLLRYQGLSSTGSGYVVGDDPFWTVVPRVQLFGGVDYVLRPLNR
jgi:hypothetical protein